MCSLFLSCSHGCTRTYTQIMLCVKGHTYQRLHPTYTHAYTCTHTHMQVCWESEDIVDNLVPDAGRAFPLDHPLLPSPPPSSYSKAAAAAASFAAAAAPLATAAEFAMLLRALPAVWTAATDPDGPAGFYATSAVASGDPRVAVYFSGEATAWALNFSAASAADASAGEANLVGFYTQAVRRGYYELVLCAV
jgi:hypothetical protein